ncbi:MAG: opacity protein [Chryseobacterium sp. 39-10]|nr:PorT family protein [Chryseobacterium sp.]OJV47441.1 MAG: opacity protein [Chryseobacterium sp. 39-10]
MKKLFLGAAIAMGSLTFAQQFGVKAGMNVSSLSKQQGLDDSKSKIGLNAGVFMNAPIAENFSIQPEVLYSQYGAKVNWTNPIGGDKMSASQNLDYITVPVMFQYNAIPSFYLEAGPEFGFLVSATNKIKNETTGASSTGSNYKDDLNTFNFGVGLGAGYYFTKNVGLNARYVAGFTDTAKNRPSGSDAVKNNVFQVGLNFKF